MTKWKHYSRPSNNSYLSLALCVWSAQIDLSLSLCIAAVVNIYLQVHERHSMNHSYDSRPWKFAPRQMFLLTFAGGQSWRLHTSTYIICSECKEYTTCEWAHFSARRLNLSHWHKKFVQNNFDSRAKYLRASCFRVESYATLMRFKSN